MRMVYFKNPQRGCPVWLSIGKRVEPRSENHVLPHAAVHRFAQTIFGIPAPKNYM
jgi:hypothetical protein